MRNGTSEMEEFVITRTRITEMAKPKTRNHTCQCGLSKRCVVTIMTMAAAFLAHSLEGNLKLAVKIMTTDMDVIIDNETYTAEAAFNWTAKEQNTVLSSFSWGYAISPFGGYLTTKMGGADLYGIVIALSGVLTIVTPLVVHFGIPLFVCTRFFLGVLIGISASASTDIFVHWAPPQERSRLTVSLCIAAYGNLAVNDLICNFIALAFSWEVLFFQTGTVCLIWYYVWFMLISNDPAEDPCISRAEKIYLKEAGACAQDEVMYSWKKIITSSSVWAFINARFVNACSFLFLVYHVPVYLKDTFNINSTENTILSAVSHLTALLVFILAAMLADNLRNRKFCPWKVHQFFVGFSHCFTVILLVYILFRKAFTVTSACLFLVRLCYCIANVSYFTYSIDMTSQYASFIVGLSNSFMTFGLLLSSNIVEVFIMNHTQAEWNMYLITLIVLNIWAGVLFYLFGSDYHRSWTLLTRHNTCKHNSSSMKSVVPISRISFYVPEKSMVWVPAMSRSTVFLDTFNYRM